MIHRWDAPWTSVLNNCTRLYQQSSTMVDVKWYAMFDSYSVPEYPAATQHVQCVTQ